MNHSLLNGKQSTAWQDLVGYDCTRLKKHLEKHFLHGMNWENRADWEIDHIIPLSAFNFETPNDPDFKKCWALQNLRPLWKSENRSKWARLAKPFQPSLLIKELEG
jgi:5-methylcytosine-specific restriction endonuclease McrA